VAATLMPLWLVYMGDTRKLQIGAVGLCLHLADALWIFDVLLNFRTALSVNGTIVTDPTAIAMRYARSWLLIDLITAWPILLAPAGMVWLLLVVKLARLARAIHLLDGLHKEIRWLPVLPVKVLLVTVLPAHLLACLWRIAARSDRAALGIEVDPPDARPWLDLYVEDTYWVMMTVTTVGYGDVSPSGRTGRILAIFTMCLAPFFNGCIVSLLTHVTKGLFDDDVERQVVQAARFLRRRRVAGELQRRVEHNLRTRLHQEHHLTLAPSLLSKLSTSMQRELTLELLSSTVLHFPLFCRAPAAFIAEIAQAHTWVQCSAGDLVVEAGQLEQEVVFVVVGRLLMFVKAEDPFDLRLLAIGSPPRGRSLATVDGGDEEKEEEGGGGDGRRGGGEEEAEVAAGAWFGEACLFVDGRVRRMTIFSQHDSELALLPASEYHRIVKKYPMLLERHILFQKEIKDGHRSLHDLTYQAPHEELPRTRRLWSLLFNRGQSRVASSDRELDSVTPS